MKILLSIVAAILVITAAGGGYLIYNLNGEIGDLQQELVQARDDARTQLSAEVASLENKYSELQAGDDALSAAIDDTKTTITKLDENNKAVLADIHARQAGQTVQISDLTAQVEAADAIIADSLLPTAALFEESKKAIVRITDGETLVGSGFIINGNTGASTSLIKKVVTAYHVIDGLNNIHVTLSDGRTWKAMVWASCEDTDIAILKFTADGTNDLPDDGSLPAVTLGDSQTVNPGDPVYVIGSPGSDNPVSGLPDTLTSGIISQVNRNVPIDGNSVTNLLQIDAAVNFGNSGGPLFDKEGRVIGVVIARMDPAMGDGISFAVAGNMIKKVEKAILAGQPGSFEYILPWLGVALTDILPSEVVENGNTVTSGAKVASATGPALSAGIQAGDIIVGLDARATRDTGEVTSFLMEYYAPGDSVTVSIIRDGLPLSFRVDLRARL